MFNSGFVLLSDNSGGYATSMAIVNPDLDPTTIDVTVRNGEGAILKRVKDDAGEFSGTRRFRQQRHGRRPPGKRAPIEFRVSGDSLGVSALGLRFHPGGSFTSFHTLSNMDLDVVVGVEVRPESDTIVRMLDIAFEMASSSVRFGQRE